MLTCLQRSLEEPNATTDLDHALLSADRLDSFAKDATFVIKPADVKEYFTPSITIEAARKQMAMRLAEFDNDFNKSNNGKAT